MEVNLNHLYKIEIVTHNAFWNLKKKLTIKTNQKVKHIVSHGQILSPGSRLDQMKVCLIRYITGNVDASTC